jgi:hypothetical protein
VHGNKNISLDVAEQPRARLAVHGDLADTLAGVGLIDWSVGVAQVHDGSADVVLLADLLQLIDVHGVTGEPDRVGKTVAAASEFLVGNDKAGALVSSEVLGGCADDLEFLPGDDGVDLFPGLEAVDGGRLADGGPAHQGCQCGLRG